MTMTYRENLVRAMRRDNPEFVPFEFGMVSTLREKLVKETGTEDLESYFRSELYYANQGIKGVGAGPTNIKHDFMKYYRGQGRDDITEEMICAWGVARKPGGFMHFTHTQSPLKMASSIKEIEDYPLPDTYADYRWEGAQEKVDVFHAEGYAVTGFVGHTFENAWQIRGMEEFLADMYVNKSWCEALIAKIADHNMKLVEKLAPMGLEVLRIGDDVGTQTGMMFSPELWRELFKPSLKAYIARAKQLDPEVLTWYHSDGDITPIIPDLIEIGLDILNPVQPECVDPVALKREYGKDLAFWGCVGTQTTMPFGSPEDVKADIKKYIEGVGYNGGLCLAPTHVLEPEVSLENIKAFIEAMEEYGKY